MAYKKPQDPLTNNGFGIYPLTTADQVILADGSRLEKNGIVSANVATAANSEKLSGKSLAEIMLTLYPVGSIYMSLEAVSPAGLFGGTWESIGGRFLLGADSTYMAGSTGGETTHTLTVEEMPVHNHGWATQCTDSVYAVSWPSWEWRASAIQSENTPDSVAGHTDSQGGNAAHNNMPPYLAVYMWKRVS